MKKIKTIDLYFWIPTIFLFLLCLFIPYASDDWAWGGSEGIERLSSLFYGYNGRIVGNLLVIILCKSYILKTIIMFLVILGIFILIKKMLNEEENSNIYFLVAVILFLLMPNILFRQTIGWVSGFANYVFSVFTILLATIIFYKIMKNNNHVSKKIILLLVILGIINSLIVEHLTVYNCFFAGGVLLFAFKRKKQYRKVALIYFLSSIIGVALMFLNPVYYVADMSYKSINTGNMLVNAFVQYKDIIFPELFSNFFLLYLIISALFIIIYILKENTNNNKFLTIINLIIIMSFPIYLFLINNCSFVETFLNSHTGYFNILFSLIYVISMLFLTCKLVLNKEKRNIVLFLIISIGVVTAPLSIVSPVTSRCFFMGYIYLIIIILFLFSYCFEIKEEKFRIKLQRILIVIFIIFALFYFLVFGKIFIKNIERSMCIKRAKENEKVVEVVKLPFSEEFLWYSEPYNDLYEKRFKDFYKLHNDVKLKYIN